MFMANLSSADPVYDEAGLSYDSDILSEVHDHDHYQDAICEHHEELEMHENVQLNHVVDSHADYTSDSNMILYDQYLKDNAVPGVQSNVSSVPNDAYMMIYNEMYEPQAQYVSKTSQNTVVDNSLTAKLATYKEQVELYERRARVEVQLGHIARNCTQPKRPQNSDYFKDKMLLMQAQENRVALDEEKLLFLAGGEDNAIDEDVDEQHVQDLALNVENVFQADDCDAFDFDVDEAPMAQTMF
nr:retrovirus-related Pol polyprotein from transposon TNT 1-94 [Tanacetum cinerariifolium]